MNGKLIIGAIYVITSIVFVNLRLKKLRRNIMEHARLRMEDDEKHKKDS